MKGSVRIGVWKALRFQLAMVCVEENEINLISDYFKGVTTSMRERERGTTSRGSPYQS